MAWTYVLPVLSVTVGLAVPSPHEATTATRLLAVFAEVNEAAIVVAALRLLLLAVWSRDGEGCARTGVSAPKSAKNSNIKAEQRKFI